MSQKNNIVVIGSSGHAKVIVDIIEKEAKYTIVGFIDSYRAVDEETLGYKVLGAESDIPRLIQEYNLRGGVVAVGDNSVRSKVVHRINSISPNFEFIKTIHPTATFARDVSVGVGTVVMAGVIINTSSVIGDHCILNTNSSLDHDSVMANFSSIAPGVTTGGNVHIGEYSAVSLGASIIHGVTIGKQVVVGAGAVVINNILDYGVAIGVPAKTVRNREEGEKYL